MPHPNFSFAYCHPNAQQLGIYIIGEEDSDLQANFSILPALEPNSAPKDCRENHLLWHAGKLPCPVELWIPRLGRHKVRLVIPPGRVLFVPAAWRWSWCLEADTPALSIRLKESACPEGGRGRLMPHFGSRDTNRLRRIEDFAACVRDELLNPHASNSHLVSAFSRLLPDLFLGHFWTRARKSDRDLEPLEIKSGNSAIERIRAFIHGGVLEKWVQDPVGVGVHLREKTLLEKAIQQEATDSGEKPLSYEYFSRCFKSGFNITLTDYFQSLRLNRALALLDEGLGGAEVAERLGFDTKDLSHFHQVFRKCFKTTPAAFAKFRLDQIARNKPQ